MSKAQKTIQKLKRKERKVREKPKSWEQIKKVQDVLQSTPVAFKLMRGIERRMDGEFGTQVAGAEPPLEYKCLALTVARFDFDPGAGTDFGIRLTMSAGVQAGTGVRPGDWVEIRESSSALHGRMLQVVSLPDATHIRLDDVATYVGPESNAAVRFLISAVQKASV